MNTEVKERWIKALRSGEYTQCKGALAAAMGRPKARKPDSYCVLGVLADVMGWPTVQSAPGRWAFPTPNGGFNGSMYLSGFDEIDLRPISANWLSSQNDLGASFETLADWIEENL